MKFARALPARIRTTGFAAPPHRTPWMVTFADMSLLLMAFFIMQLSVSDHSAKTTRASGSLADAAGPRIVPVVGSAPNALAGDGPGFETFDATDPARAGLALGRALAEGRVEIVRIGESLALHFTALEERGKDENELKRRTADALEALARLSVARDRRAAPAD